MGFRKRLTPEQAKSFGFEVKPKVGNKNPQYYFNNELIDKKDLSKPIEKEDVVKNKTDSEINDTKSFVLSAWNKNGKVMNIDEFCLTYKLPKQDIIRYKLVSHTGTPYFNIEFKEQINEEALAKEIDFDGIIKKYIDPYKFKPVSKNTGIFLFDRLVYTDVHIAMDPNQNGFSLYGGVWDEDEILERAEIMISHVLNHKKGDELIIDELGDFMDGWDGETVRKGHALPQNMDNEKAFDVGLEFKIRLINGLAPHYSKIKCNNICNDNHAGSFGYVVNKGFKKFIEYKYNHIKVNNIRKFIDHYVKGKNCFIISHGKDGKNLKFGFKPVLDTKQSEKIDNYIKEHRLFDYIIEFSKGDSHQKIFDESTSDYFDYYNYPAFSPSSEWVQTNFKKGMSGFEFFNFKEDGQKTHNPYRFDWKTKL